MEIKLMTEEHLGEVAELERLSFSTPWSEDSLRMLLGENALACVAVENGKVVAWGGMLTVLDEGQITNIATHPDYRRRGFGRAVVSTLSDMAEDRGLSSVFLEVRRSNAGAISLYTSCGYSAIGERRGFYSNPTEDAVLMMKPLGEK